MEEKLENGQPEAVQTTPAGSGENDAVKAEYEAKLSRMQEDHTAEMNRVRLDGELRYVLARMGAKNPLVAAKAVDLSGVAGAEEGFRGLEDCVKRLMESDPYLFEQTSGIGAKLASGGVTGGVHGAARRDPDMLSDEEYYREFRI